VLEDWRNEKKILDLLEKDKLLIYWTVMGRWS